MAPARHGFGSEGLNPSLARMDLTGAGRGALETRAAFNAIVGCCPLTAPACFKAAQCGRGGHGWGHHEAKTRKVYNMLCEPLPA